jgi:hypothetical protein
MIAHVIIKNPERVDMITQAEAAPQDINAKIMQLNQQGGLDAHTCADVDWIALAHHKRCEQSRSKTTSKRALKSLCDGYYNFVGSWMQSLPGRHPEAHGKSYMTGA